MPDLSIQECLRAGHVKRWHIVRVGREQSIAEHMYLVWLLTMELCDRLRADDRVHELAEQWALHHDLPEVIVGDLPTPTKRAMKVGGSNLIDRMEDEASDRVRLLRAELDKVPDAVLLVKTADLIESLRFLAIEKMDAHGAQVEKYLNELFLTLINGSQPTTIDPDDFRREALRLARDVIMPERG